MSTAFQILIGILALKAILIGSDFDFYEWIKHGKKYREWYNNREEFREYLAEQEESKCAK